MGSLAQVLEDCFGVLQLFSDGTVRRANESDMDFGDGKDDAEKIVEDGCRVEWEDCMFDEKHQLYLRVYKPSYTKSMNNHNNKRQKMPILYYIHGGGFCLGSRTWPNCHSCCLRLSSQLQLVVIAPDYRLAPEHRLPAAIEDGYNSVKWLQLRAQEIKEGSTNNSNNVACNKLLDDGVDFEKVFIMGDSSGGNIAHHLAARLGSGSPELFPVRICGYVLLAPFFGGSLRTKSEADGPPEPLLTLDSLDRFWRLSLPKEESRDHPIANPFGPHSPSLESVGLDPMLVIVGGKEIMKDRVKEYAIRMKKLGNDVTYVEFEGQYHGFLTHDPFSRVSNQLSQLIKRFIISRSVSC